MMMTDGWRQQREDTIHSGDTKEREREREGPGRKNTKIPKSRFSRVNLPTDHLDFASRSLSVSLSLSLCLSLAQLSKAFISGARGTFFWNHKLHLSLSLSFSFSFSLAF